LTWQEPKKQQIMENPNIVFKTFFRFLGLVIAQPNKSRIRL